jgi:hypothetical protein
VAATHVKDADLALPRAERHAVSHHGRREHDLGLRHDVEIVIHESDVALHALALFRRDRRPVGSFAGSE